MRAPSSGLPALPWLSSRQNSLPWWNGTMEKTEKTDKIYFLLCLQGVSLWKTRKGGAWLSRHGFFGRGEDARYFAGARFRLKLPALTAQY